MEETTTMQADSCWRRLDVPGLEIRGVQSGAAEVACYSTGYEFVVPTTWRGTVRHRGRSIPLGTGRVLCAAPEEMYVLRSSTASDGAWHVVSLDPWVLGRYVTAGMAPQGARVLASDAPLSDRIQHGLLALLHSRHPDASRQQVESALTAFITACAFDLFVCDTNGATAEPDAVIARRILTYLRSLGTSNVDLDAVASEAGLSRFRALRAFKRVYGLPPCAFQLRVKLGVAQRALQDGVSPAVVAARCGFVDQSHLTRHFKRAFGMTPARYARVGRHVTAPPPAPVAASAAA